MVFSDINSYSEKSNIILTQTIANVLWPQISGMVKTIEEQAKMKRHQSVKESRLVYDMIDVMLDEPILELVQGTNVLKVKLFDLEGLTLYSTKKSDTGSRKAPDYPAIVQASEGFTTTHIKFHESYITLTGEELKQRYVLSSYLPVRNLHSNQVEGIFEIYSDVTDVYTQINKSQLKFAFALACIFFVIFIVLYFVLRYLDRVINNNIELAVARDSEKDANKSKSQFLANMSHELRTPLNAIIGYSELLEEDCDDGENTSAKKDLVKIQTAAKHLLNLINEILDLSKIEAGQMALYIEDLDVADLIKEVTSVVKPLVEEKGNHFVIQCSDTLGLIRSDSVKLRQVLFNLLSNSAKFTERGYINLRVIMDDSWLVITISDTGIGMSDQQLTRLFKPFVQADDSTTRKYGGTGLGLAISKQYCEMMGGSISVKSTDGKGSTFTVRIPAESEQLEVMNYCIQVPE